MVAKSFQSMTQVCEPYEKNGRMYVRVLNEKTKNEREVRWYTDAEYAKMYGEKTGSSNPSPTNRRRSRKDTLGFENGYITIFKGNTYANLEWFQGSIARFHKIFGWYIISTEGVPCDLPVGLTPVRLPYEDVFVDENTLKSDDVIKEAVENLIYDRSASKYQGAVGERIERTLTVYAAHSGENYYGKYTVHYMEDADGNRYLWNTGSKSWEVGDMRHIKGTVKEHKIMKNAETTILTRCSVVKE